MKFRTFCLFIIALNFLSCSRGTNDPVAPTAQLKVTANGSVFEFNESDRTLEFGPKFSGNINSICAQILTVRKTSSNFYFDIGLVFSLMNDELKVGTYNYVQGISPATCGNFIFGECSLNSVNYQSKSGDNNEFVITKIENKRATGRFKASISLRDVGTGRVTLDGEFSNIPVKR